MSAPALSVVASVPTAAEAQILVVSARADAAAELLGGPLPDGLAEALAEQLPLVGFGGGADELVRLAVDGRAVAVIGLGKDGSADGLRAAAGSAVRQLAGAASVALVLPVSTQAELQAALTGAALGSYSFTEYRHASKDGQKTPVGRIAIVTDAAGLDPERAVARAAVEAEASAWVKDLVNTPPLDLTPAALAERALAHVAGLPVATRVWDEAQLEADGFGGILGVGQGSTRPPRLVKLDYAPAGAEQHIALVGKGITFDSGGLSLKPPVGMVGMKYDMTGAATVAAVVAAAARLELPVRVSAWLCVAENMPSGSAIRPNDVLRIRGGKTVEVLNTDAEGRLVMADGLVAASEDEPDEIIDVATLTGAKLVALGVRYSAVMGDDGLIGSLEDAAADAGELIWQMPLPDELRATIASQVADISNANPGVAHGGMLLAGVFLREFVGSVGEGAEARRIPWAHLDIAGSDENKGAPYGFTGKGPTAVTVRTLIAHAERVGLAPRH